MKKNHFALAMAIIAAVAVIAHAQPYSIDWQTQFATHEQEDSHGVATDFEGNVFITGETVGTLPGATRIGATDFYLKKYSGSGAELWTRQLGTTSFDLGQAVTVDVAGNSFVAGFTSGIMNGTNAGGFDAFLSKTDGNGNTLWSRQIGLRGDDVATSVAIDPLGNIVISGYSEEDTFSPLPTTRDSFVAKFDNAGNLLWNKKFGVPELDESNAVRTDSLGNVYFAGRGASGAYLKKLDSAGELVWDKQFGVGNNDFANALAIDAADNLYMSGLTAGAIGSSTTAGSIDAYLMKLDTAGNTVWTRLFGTVGPDVSTAVAVDAAGNPFMTGIENQDPLGYTVNSDVFVAKYNAAGDQLWTATLGSTAVDQARSLALDGFGNVYVAGYTEGNLTGTNHRSGDAFLIKFAPVPEPGSLTLLAAACCAIACRRCRLHA